MIKLKNLDFKNIVEHLIDTFLNAGKVAKEIRKRGVKITIKKDNTPVTDGDMAVDDLIRKKILNLTPNIPIISEETVNTNERNIHKTFWLIDPIDGTRDYIKKGEEYTLNAALIVNLEPLIGVVYAPEKERLFYTYGKGFAFELSNGKKTVLNCKKIDLNEIIALVNSDKTTDEILNIHKNLSLHSLTDI